ncbi:MAG: CHAT domain-containing protein, partial [bacterium]|nr:CHAT domain-containing protein [bacterium]
NRSAFNYAERARARAFQDMLAESRADIRKGATPELLIRERKLEQDFAYNQSLLTKEFYKKENKVNQAKVNTLTAKIRELEEDFDKLKLEMTRKNPKYAALKYPKPFTLKDIQKVLENNTILLEYMVNVDSTILWKIGKNQFDSFRFNIGREELERRVKLLRYLSTTTGDVSSFVHHSHMLYDKILAPAVAGIGKKKQLVIAADGILNYLPFETLCMNKPRTKAGFKKLPFLLKKYPILYIQSAGVWAALNKSPKPPREKTGPKLLAMGDPLFKKEGHPEENALIRSAFNSLTKPAPAQNNQAEARNAIQNTQEPRLGFKRLVHSGEEVKAIGKLFQPADIFLRARAREENIKQCKNLDQYRYLHFATHGILNENKPQYSGLVLAQDDDPSEDGFLHMREIFNLKINADLVVLSACRTGLGKLVKGEGIIGLTRAWMYAGTPSVVVSLWEVDDASTAHLMQFFYKNLKNNMNKSRALRKAKLKLLKQTGRIGSWAGFVLIGRE